MGAVRTTVLVGAGALALLAGVVAFRTATFKAPGPEDLIILMAHQDLVPVAEETLGQWKAEPFSGAIKDGAVWGRGSVDDKGSLVAILDAAEVGKRSRGGPSRLSNVAGRS